VTCCFAIIPDGMGEPAAVFEDLEDAVDWGLRRYGCDAFGIRYLEVTPIEAARRPTKRAV
jgi:hypothetical protein